MKRYFFVQLMIDVVIIILGFIVCLFPSVSAFNANIVFYTMMSIYAGLELCEYIISYRKVKEGLYLFFASGTVAFSGFFLREYPDYAVLSISLIVWLLMITIIKMINLENIEHKKSRLFIIKLTAMSMNILIGLLISANIFYQTSTIGYLLALLYISYGFLELASDFLEFLSKDTKFLKE